jgi:hypothetical protein
VLESRQRLASDIQRLLDVIRETGGGRYACLLEPGALLFESAPAEAEQSWMLRQFLKEKSGALFALPEAMDSGGPAEDVFADWTQDEFYLAFINRRVVLVVACAEAEPLREEAMRPLKVLADRLLRYNQTWRVGPKGGGGFFFGRAQLDIVVVGREQDE